MKHVLKGVSLCVMFGLSSCHTTLYNAAKEGDVETVRQELAAGVPMNKSASKANLIWQIPTALITVPLDVAQAAGVPLLVTPIAYALATGSSKVTVKFLSDSVFNFGDKTPLEVAYEKGHTAVVDEFAKAGATVAPDSVSQKLFVTQTLWRGEDPEISFERPEISTKLFSTYWNNEFMKIQWRKDDAAWSPSTLMEATGAISWKDGNTVSVTESMGKGDDYKENRHQLEYHRSGVRTAFVVYRFQHDRINRSYDNYTYYELNFETPSSGTFNAIARETLHDWSDHWTSGRFWLKDAPATAEPAKKAPAKKKGRR